MVVVVLLLLLLLLLLLEEGAAARQGLAVQQCISRPPADLRPN